MRGIAILMVLVGHVMRHRFPNGGAAGVTVFFALSGFLITSLLMDESRRFGRISFPRFYERRVRRLLPALVVYLAFWWTLSAAGVGGYQVVPSEVLAALFYYMNWVLAIGTPVSNPMGITWSLSIEEQFYLLWPLTFLFAKRWPRAQWTVAVLGIIYAVTTRIAQFDGPAVNSIYYRTDTRMDSLLIGCVTAILVHARGMPRRVAGVAPASVLALLMMFMLKGEELKFVVVPLIGAIATCGLLVAAIARIRPWLRWAPLRWFGTRSYALYLWHYPLVALAWPEMNVLRMWQAVALAVVAAEASWWLVERPFRTVRRLDDAVELQRPG